MDTNDTERRGRKAPAESHEAKKKEEDSPVKRKTGISAGDLLKAPVKPPEPDDSRPPKASQSQIVLAGVALIAAALLLWLTLGFLIALWVAVVGVVFVAAGTLVRI